MPILKEHSLKIASHLGHLPLRSKIFCKHRFFEFLILRKMTFLLTQHIWPIQHIFHHRHMRMFTFYALILLFTDRFSYSLYRSTMNSIENLNPCNFYSLLIFISIFNTLKGSRSCKARANYLRIFEKNMKISSQDHLKI